MELLTRTALAGGIALLGLGVYWAWNRWQLIRLGRVALPGLEAFRCGLPAILYFTTPDCVPCRTTQRPALERLLAELAEAVQLIEVDASAQPKVADYWGVLTVPTTFVIDPQGRPRRVNHGVTNAEKLKAQLEEIGSGSKSPGPKRHSASSLSLKP